jgi:subtilisin family serine protease
MDALDQIRLRRLMNISSGIPEVVIGVIDGPVDFNHTAFQGSKIRTAAESELVACKRASSIACMHGTFVAGILCARRGFQAPAICPSCEVILHPIFSEERLNTNGPESTIPSSTPEELSKAIVQTIDAGANIVNLSLGISSTSLITHQRLKEAYDYALRREVILVAAAGNQGSIGRNTILDHHWIIPVAACDNQGMINPISNFGHFISRKGLMAPGMDVISTAPNGKYIKMSGTSAAAPFVTGTIALLWSIFPHATAGRIIRSLFSNTARQRTIIPSILNAYEAYQKLLRQGIE